MKRKVIGICDTEKSYVEAFSHFFQKREGMRFDVRGFSRADLLIDYLSEEKPDFMYVTEGFMEETPELEGLLPEEGTVVLTDGRAEQSHGYRAVDRYVSAQELIKLAVDYLCPEETQEDAARKPGARMIGVYSPVGRCGKTMLTLALGQSFSTMGSCLCVSLDAITGHSEFMPDDSRTGISELMYLSASGASLPDMDIDRDPALNILPGSSCPEDILSASPGIMEKTIRQLRDNEDYRYIVLDIGDDTIEAAELMSLCSEVIMPVPEDDISERKADNWETLYGQHLGEKIKRITAIPKRELDSWARNYAAGYR